MCTGDLVCRRAGKAISALTRYGVPAIHAGTARLRYASARPLPALQATNSTDEIPIPPLVAKLVTCYIASMQVIARRTLRQFRERHPQADRPIRAWLAVVSKARWNGPEDVKRQFGTTVDFVGDNRVVFDLSGNKYRLIVHISYVFGRVLVKFVGTHAQYDRIDPETVRWRR